MLKKMTCFIGGLLVAAASLQAVLLTDTFSGSFTSGDLSGEFIFGSYEIETFGLTSGDAVEIDFITTEGLFNSFSISFFDGVDMYEFDLDSDPSAEATFANGQVVGFDFFGTDMLGNTLEFTYDAYQPTAETAISLVFTDFFTTNQSVGTVDLATGVVPEPSSFAMIAGFIALGFSACRRGKRA